MKKSGFQEVQPRSARETIPDSSDGGEPTLGAIMSLDDLPKGDDARAQHVEDSLRESVVPQAAPQNGEPARPPATGNETHHSVPATVTTAQAAPVATIPPAPITPPTTRMIATPIDSILRQRVRDLRGNFEISEAFVVETALREFFANRPTEVIAADLRARGGRLRRNR